VTLIVPDGNWGQAGRVRRRVPGLIDLPCVTLPTGPASEYRLRAETRAEGLATIEAIARAFGILEGLEVQHAIESVFALLVERTRWSRGEISRAQLTHPLPQSGTSR
jgi:DTW domain-containing protein